MSDDKKPVDLEAIRMWIARGGHASQADALAMADEIEALREAIRWVLEETDFEADGPCPKLRALLPLS